MGEKSVQKKKYILEKARAVFSEKGFKNVTMKDIVDACEISRGGLYLYFSSTEEIFLAVLADDSSEDDEEAVVAALSGDASAGDERPILAVTTGRLERLETIRTIAQSNIQIEIGVFNRINRYRV